VPEFPGSLLLACTVLQLSGLPSGGSGLPSGGNIYPPEIQLPPRCQTRPPRGAWEGSRVPRFRAQLAVVTPARQRKPRESALGCLKFRAEHVTRPLISLWIARMYPNTKHNSAQISLLKSLPAPTQSNLNATAD
jgi:hypothetical protein